MIVDWLLIMAILASGGHPRLYQSPADLSRAADNLQQTQWAKMYRDDTVAAADKWAAMSDEQLRALIPPVGSVFAYGFNGCPECGASWSFWGSGITSLDKPGVVTCIKCKMEFPNEKYPDSGQGWRDEKSGKTYYFLGCHNAYVGREVMLKALPNLAFAYALTKDNKYSHAAAMLYDKLAELYPTSTTGSIDYPSTNNSGRLEQPQYQVARLLVKLAESFDLLYDSPDFAAPSVYGKGSVRDHIETNVIADGGKYCYDMAFTGYCGLTNGQADYIRGTLAAGIMLDKKEWIDFAVSGPYGIYSFLDNCLDRDGQYYETSVGYSDHGIGLYIDMGEMLYRMRTADYPDGINIFTHPKFEKTLAQSITDVECFGHYPRFGDWGPDVAALAAYDQFSLWAYLRTEYLVARAADEAASKHWRVLRKSLAFGDEEQRRSSKALAGFRQWLTFNAEPIAHSQKPLALKPQTLLGGRGATIFRSGEGINGRAALLRYGPSLNHGHYDDLNINFFALGRELTYDIGYSLGSAHVQVGWANKTASHNLVVVNEKSQMLSDGGGGYLYFCTDQAPLRAVEASSEASYASENVKTYRRTMALIDTDDSSYLLDIFRVAGGAQHDLMWHFLGELDSVTGAQLGDVQETGSLAGPDIDWGRKIGPSGYLIDCQDKGDYWNPPPGNGYGFLYNVRRADTGGNNCTMTWKFAPDNPQSVKLTLLPEPDCELITATGPGILTRLPNTDFSILRRRGSDLTSAFISIVEPCESDCKVISANRMICESGEAIGIEVQTASGIDYILSSISDQPSTLRTKDGKCIEFDGQFGFIRTSKGRVTHSRLIGGALLAMEKHKLTSDRTEVRDTIQNIDYDNAKVTLYSETSANLLANGGIAYFSNGRYSHTSPYLVKSIDGAAVTLDGDMIIGRGRIGTDKAAMPDAIANIVPLPRSVVVSRKPSHYFKGKLIRNDATGQTTTIIDVEANQRTVRVKDPSIFGPNDTFTIYDLQPGDRCSAPVVVGTGLEVRG
ncbi:MAG: hypothetical protein GX139_07765 [Armatimonadetes bacterium]|jgi:hypothetical protein|nr:hypothetical protein [Armatimonadota bacterium]